MFLNIREKKFCDLAFDPENHENFCLAKISCYTVLVRSLNKTTLSGLFYKGDVVR